MHDNEERKREGSQNKMTKYAEEESTTITDYDKKEYFRQLE